MKLRSALMSATLVLGSTQALAAWSTTGILNDKGQPGACVVSYTSKTVMLRAVLDPKLTPARMDISPVGLEKNDRAAYIKIDKQDAIILDPQNKELMPQLLQKFKSGSVANVITAKKKVAQISLTGFTRALNACGPLMK